MNDAQYHALMTEVIRGNNLLIRIVNAVEEAKAPVEKTLRENLLASLPPSVGDTVEITEADLPYFKAGTVGTIIEDSGEDLWRVDFRYNDNDPDSYKDTGGAYGGRWYVRKTGCTLVKQGTL